MRELFLRQEAERVGAPGKSGPPTPYFEAQTRRLLLRNPRFALRYLRATKRAGGRETLAGRQGRGPDVRFPESIPAPAENHPA
jgi:hypothetical protein